MTYGDDKANLCINGEGYEMVDNMEEFALLVKDRLGMDAYDYPIKLIRQVEESRKVAALIDDDCTIFDVRPHLIRQAERLEDAKRSLEQVRGVKLN